MKNKPLRIAFYGKGGIGKSSIASNISAALSHLGLNVLHIGCDPKGDSTRTLLNKTVIPVMSLINENTLNMKRNLIVHKGYNGVSCIETGGPKAGVGCAGMGISILHDELNDLGILNESWDIIVYDVLGDVVCGGFAMPMRQNYIDQVYIVTSTEFMSIYAANNIMNSLHHFSAETNSIYGGLILNHRSMNDNANIIHQFSIRTKSTIIGEIPYSKEIQIAELKGETLFQINPTTSLSETFLTLGKRIVTSKKCDLPTPLSLEDLESFKKYILNLELYHE